jgi:hypothetical protein
MISRRSFLLGLGGLVTSAFVSRATVHAFSTGSPLLPDPGRAEETLYLYEGFDLSDGPWATKWRVSLGPDQWPAPPAPPWHEFLRRHGYDLSRPADLHRALRNWSIGADDLHQPVCQYIWEDRWEAQESPQARAFNMLKELKLDVALNEPGETAGRTLLQARLIDRKLPIRVKVSEM